MDDTRLAAGNMGQKQKCKKCKRRGTRKKAGRDKEHRVQECIIMYNNADDKSEYGTGALPKSIKTWPDKTTIQEGN